MEDAQEAHMSFILKQKEICFMTDLDMKTLFIPDYLRENNFLQICSNDYI